MNIFKTKKFIYTTLIFILFTTLSFGMLQVFQSKNVHTKDVYAFSYEGNDVDLDTIATISAGEGWTKTGDGVYVSDVGYNSKSGWLGTTYSSKTATLTMSFTISALSELKLSVAVTSGDFSMEPAATVSTDMAIALEPGSYTYTFNSSSKTTWIGGKEATGNATVKILSLKTKAEGIDGTDINAGMGIEGNEYIIDEPSDLVAINESLSSHYKLMANLDMKDVAFTPIGRAAPFTGKFDGNGYSIKNLTINGGNYSGLFAQTNAATISNLTLENVQINGAGSYVGALIGQAEGGTLVDGVKITDSLSSSGEILQRSTINLTGANIGGLIGYSSSKTGVNVTNCEVNGCITNNKAGNVGGLIGAGGTFTNCTTTADVSGVLTVGGFVGGNGVDSQFTNCTMAGTVSLIGEHSNNYPYMGLLNGYGAWNYFNLSSSGQNLSVNFTTTEKTVDKIQIFNSNVTPTGIDVAVPTPDANGNYSFTQFVELTNTYVGSQLNAGELTSEVKYNGITGNYGGFTIRFTMSDGTYKYISTLDRENACFRSILDINLDELTSYTDNFSSLTILSKGTITLDYESNIPFGGSVQISTAEDFEHLSWVVNGCIPTTFGSGDTTYAYNGRSIATLSVDLQADIDLSNSTQFYGFGQSEMLPYRGSIYGNNHTIKVNMVYENAYLLGIINCSTDTQNYVTIENLTVEGTIHGKYRVGIVAMSDHHNRGTKLKMVNVKNYANMTALSQVGAMLGNAQGAKSVLNSASSNTFDSCVNYGTITATEGSAGGLIGSLGRNSDEGSYTITNCANYGVVNARVNAGGFVAWTRNAVTFTGENISAGALNGTYNFFIAVGGMTTTNATMKTIYSLDFGVSNLNLDIKATNENGNISFANSTFTTDTNGIVKVEMLNIYTLSGVTLTANVIIDGNINILKTPQKVALSNQTMLTSVTIPVDIEIWDENNNVYNTTSSTDSWVLKANVIFNRNIESKTTNIETIDLVGYVGEQELSTLLNANQLVFINVTLTHSIYNIPQTADFIKNLYRITTDVENYVTFANNLLTKTSGTNAEFKTLGLNAKNSYDTLVAEISGYSSENLTRFNEYISNKTTNIKNINASDEILKTYYQNIASTIEAETTQTLDYGNYTFEKSITFTMLSGDVITKDITYIFAKTDISSDLKATATTNGVSFNVGEIITCSYNGNVAVTVNPIAVGIKFINNETAIYNGLAQTISAELTVLAGDETDITFKLTYNDIENAVEVGTYVVKLTELGGGNAIYYNIPEDLQTGKLVINQLKYTVNANAYEEFTYNTIAQATDYTLTQNANNYELKNVDYSISYSGNLLSGITYSSSNKPTQAGEYTATLSLNNKNLTFVNSNTFTFKILPVKLNSVNFDTQLEYNSAEQHFAFEFVDLLGEDKLVVEYQVLDNSGAVSKALNAGDYTLKITNIGNDNYYFENLTTKFNIAKESLTYNLFNQQSIYGEDIVIDQTKLEKTSGIIYGTDDLGLKISSNVAALSPVGEYKLTLTITNENYSLPTTEATYFVTKREVIITYNAQTNFEYNAQDFFSEIKPIVTNVIDKDLTAFNFVLSNENGICEEFKYVGNYTIELIENAQINDILNNYSINQKQANYSISKKALSIKPKYIEKNYNQTISETDFKVETSGIAGADTLDKIIEFNYVVSLDDVAFDYNNLNVGEYVISLESTNLNLQLSENYSITLNTNILKIIERTTYIDADFIDYKIYDGKELEFKAKLVDENNDEISGASISIEIKLNNETTNTIKNVGKYTISVLGTAGDNNKSATAEYEIEIATNYITMLLSNPNSTYNKQTYVPNFSYEMSKLVDVRDIITCNVLDANKIETTAMNVGDYYVEFSIEDENYHIINSLFDVQILPYEIALTIKNQVHTYGDSFDIQLSEYSLDKELFKDDKLDLVFICENFENTVGEYALKVKNNNSNYKVTSNIAKLEIVKRKLGLEYSGLNELTFNENGYDELLTVKVSNAITEDVYSIYYLNANNEQISSIVDAGEYCLVVEIKDTHNYKFQSSDENKLSANIVVSKKLMNLDIRISDKVYDGTAAELKGVYSENELVETNLYTLEYYYNGIKTNVAKNAGSYEIKVNETIAKNYQFTNNTKEFIINLRELTINEIASEFIYSREIIKPELTLNNVVAGEDVYLSVEYVETAGKFVEADEYTIKIKGIVGADVNNYSLNSEDSVKYCIIPAKINVEVVNTEFVFTNKQIAKKDLGLTFVGEIEVIESDYSLSILPTTVGKYSIDFISNNSSIEFSLNQFEINIVKADIEEITFESKSVDYDNQVHNLFVNKTILSNGIILNVEYSGTNFVDAGSYEITATLTNSNYNTKVLTATLTINQISLNIAVSKQNEFTYNAKSQAIEILNMNTLWYAQLINYTYIGKNYSSISKPIDSGEYCLELKANNENNIYIENPINNFKINTKGITVTSTQSQEVTYNAQSQEFVVNYIGVIENENVSVNVSYNQTNNIPKDAGTYEIRFVSLYGTNANNYHIENLNAKTTFTIKPYQITIKAHNQTVVYGDEEKPLTFSCDNLLGTDSLSGNLIRESGTQASSYIISQGSLTAGENYSITFENAMYNITRRELGVEEFIKVFTYNGNSQVPSVKFINVVAGDSNVAKANVNGDTVNAGTYILQLVVLNPNYKLPENSNYEIVINKLEASEKIIALITTETDYNGLSFEPMVMIDGDYDYTLSYSINGESVDEMINAGTYQVKVRLNSQNYKGSKTFDFVVNKINFSETILTNIKVEISSDSFILSGLENISASVDNVNFNGSTIENLTSKTKYNVFVLIYEDENHKTTSFLLGEYSTCPSAEVINDKVEELIVDTISGNDIEEIKDILKDYQNLSEIEQNLLNDENFLELQEKYEQYFNQIDSDIEEVKIVSDLVDFGGGIKLKKFTTSFAMLGVGMLFIKKRKKKDESDN